MRHVEATYAPMQASFRLDAIPNEVAARLREHRELCFQSSNNDSPALLVPLDIRWLPAALRWPSTEGAPDWHVFEGLSVLELDALVPLCAWALSAHASLPRARAALAEAIVDHPFVDDLFCADEALLVGARLG